MPAFPAVLYAGGLRRSEAVALDVADYKPATGAVTVRHGKGNKARIVYSEPGARPLEDNRGAGRFRAFYLVIL